MLEDEGITVTTAAALDIEKILANTNVENLKQLSELKYQITPLLCRNKEDQDKTHKIFEKLDAKAAVEYKEHEEESGEQIIIKKEIKSNWEKFKSPWYLKKIITPAVIVLILLVLGYFFRDTIFNRKPPLLLPPKISIDTNHDQVVVNDTVVLTAVIDSSLDKENISVDWRLDDTVVQNSLFVTKIITDTLIKSVTAILKNSDGAAIDSAEYSLKALCELPPSVAIDETDVSSNKLKLTNSNKKRFEPLFTNADENKKAYTYQWYVDSSLYSTDSVLNYSKPYDIIKLVVDTKGTHCSADSLVAQIESVPALKATIIGDGNLKISSTYNWKNIWMSLLLLLILPGIISFLLYRIILSVKTYTSEIKKIEPGTEGPFKIKFQDQHQNINTEGGIRKLADVLRKRQVSNMYKLNLRKTIRSTVIAGGIPNLEFTPLTKPMSYLVFIDKEKPESLLVKLFEYLAEKLEKEEVNIFVYEYFKEPLFLSNEKLNQERIPLQKIAALYPDTTLFIFGDAQYFLFPLKGTVKNWVTHKLNNWQTKILITPYAVDDWDKKEKLLIDSNFFVLPADLSSISLIDKIISGQIDIPGQKKEHLEHGYRARLLNFQDFETLKTYAGEGPLFQWICSLAVYPATDWDFTIAVGKAIEDQINKNGTQTELVNYTNLLKIARISWMQDDIINEGLRAKMLEYLDKNAEELARQTLNQQLHLIEDTIDDNSLVKARFEIHKKLNKFLLDSYQHKKISKEDEAFVKRSLEKNRLDEGQDIYLNKGTNSLLMHPFKKEKDVGISRYFKLETYRHILNSAGYALMIMFALMLISFNLVKSNSGYLNWSSVKPVKQTYILNVYSNNPGREVRMDLYNEPAHLISSVQNFFLGNASDTFNFNDVSIIDTTGYGLFQISTNEGQLITQDSFKLNSVLYTININEVAKIPLKIYYKDASSITLVNTLADNLPADFNITTQQFGLNDTASAAVFYFSKEHEKDASLAAMATGTILEKNITPRLADSVDFTTANADVVVYINLGVTCTPLAITALSPSLNEIWHGGTANRLININLSKNVLYYSVNDTKTFGTYGIDEICLTKDGAYKIITKSNQGYKLFFIRNVNRKSFELSVCQNFVQSKAELENKDESFCGAFFKMTLFYETDPAKIFIPVSGSILAVSEKGKLDKFRGSGKLISKTDNYDIALYSSSKYLPQLEKSAIGKILSNSSVNYGVSKAGFPIMDNPAIPSSNPFQRNYLVFNSKKTEPAEREKNPPSKQPEKNQPPQQIPDCSVTYTSLEQVRKLNNPLIVCKLNLSKAGLTSIPKELYTFINMQKLNLDTTTISKSEIDQLQKALPACKISYISSSPNAQRTVQQAPLGDINFEKGRMTSNSINLLKSVGKSLLSNKNASIILEAEYSDGNSQKYLMGYVAEVTAYFYKMGLSEKSGQIKQKITETKIDQQKQESKRTTRYEALIGIIGINFPADFNSSTNKTK